jgi:hypothetical protein
LAPASWFLPAIVHFFGLLACAEEYISPVACPPCLPRKLLPLRRLSKTRPSVCYLPGLSVPKMFSDDDIFLSLGMKNKKSNKNQQYVKQMEKAALSSMKVH